MPGPVPDPGESRMSWTQAQAPKASQGWRGDRQYKVTSVMQGRHRALWSHRMETSPKLWVMSNPAKNP